MKLTAPLIAMVLMLSACSDNHNKDEVRFIANTGDEALYWVQHVTRTDLGSAYASEASTLTLLRYRVDQANSDALKFSVTPQYLRHYPYCNTEFVKDPAQTAKRCAFMWEGFELNLNPVDGSLLSIQGKAGEGWQAMLDQGANISVKSLRNTINTPGFIQTIPKAIGSKITVDDFSGFPLTMTVDRISSHDLELSFTQDTPQIRQYGKAIVNQSDGWLEHAILITEKPLGAGQTAYARTVMVKTDEYDAPGLAIELEDHKRVDQNWANISEVSESLAARKTPIGNTYFQFDEGNVLQLGDIALADLKVSDKTLQPPGEIRFETIRGHSSSDPDFNIKFTPQFTPLVFSSNNGIYARIQLIALESPNPNVLGWLDSITAELVYYPAKIDSYSIPWPPGSSKAYSLGDGRLTITHIAGNPDLYEVTYFSANQESLVPIFEGVEGQINQLPPKVGPQWLGLADRPLVPGNQTSWQLKVDNAPEQITLYIKTSENEPTQRHKVVWLR